MTILTVTVGLTALAAVGRVVGVQALHADPQPDRAVHDGAGHRAASASADRVEQLLLDLVASAA